MATASGSKKERVLANLEELDFQNFLARRPQPVEPP